MKSLGEIYWDKYQYYEVLKILKNKRNELVEDGESFDYIEDELNAMKMRYIKNYQYKYYD